ncbi:hypothetical protein BAZ12_12425 [Elizabethkingia miricola]|uniref:DoxX family protein n=1 Tax=Elizabethkingia miricola TaxID=172045 RepID=A0ABD4DP94_ELIMR|nr:MULTISPECIES: hypothetical protein [Elizabethkingia]KUY20751.1 hypothetical protein ATB95_07565 [Elizabethkingia miricola]MCL1653051.1 hypothetical protein [Elizabethkingia miricola]MCL1677839.1 hypothetical protein [Elizabethkingia miricola]OPC70572.1 hypothetical protein BAZ12_12425 [Elizabethkingia miricola]OPC74582.1 hypothetical protein BAZ13_16915 [Elizabethkingia miricola]
MNKKILLKAFEWSLVLFVSFYMGIYGASKYIQFDTIKNYNGKVSEMSGHQVMWAFYGYNIAYPVIIGVFEIIGAVCLLFYRTRIFGAILLSAILFNIILQDYFYGIVALGTAIFFQLIIFIILYINKQRVISLARNLFSGTQNKTEYSRKDKISILVGIFVIVSLFVFVKTLLRI